MTEEPEIVYVARDQDGTLQLWSEEPVLMKRDWKADEWASGHEDCDPGSMDPDRFMDIDDGEIGMFELRRLR